MDRFDTVHQETIEARHRRVQEAMIRFIEAKEATSRRQATVYTVLVLAVFVITTLISWGLT